MVSAAVTLLNARWIIPVEPEGRVLERHSLVLQDQRIAALLPQAQARQHFPTGTEVALDQHVLLPGLINAHTHASMSLLRGFADDLPLNTWLQEHIWPAEARWVSPEFVADGTRLAIAEMLRGGVTCFNDMYFFPEVTAIVARECGIRASIGLIALDFPTRYAASLEDYLAKGLALHTALQADHLLCVTLAPHAPYTVSATGLERIGQLAAERGLPIHIHVHETAAEVAQFEAEHGYRPLERLRQIGLVSPHLQAVHMTQLNSAEIEAVTQAGGHVVHCPQSNLKLASGFCPVARLDAAGVNVALGTDGAASNNDLDLFDEMRTAALLAKGVTGDARALPAARVLRMATLNGAKALGLDQDIGSLTPGKAADVIAVDLGQPETEPVYHPLSQVVYAANRQQVSDVWIAGQRVLHNRQLTTLDLAETVQRARAWRERIWAGHSGESVNPTV